MRLLVVLAHPVSTSFVAGVHRAFVETAAAAGHEVRELDLYGIGFEPAMSRAERLRYMERDLNREGIEDQLEHLCWAEGLVLIYPTWWYSLPAMLKGWIDRVFVPYETFELGAALEPVVGRLPHIRLLGGISTYGSPRWWIRLVVHDPGRKIVMKGIRPLCARRCRTFWLGHHLMDRSTPATRTAFLARVERLARTL